VQTLERLTAAKIKTLPDGSRENLSDGLAGTISLYDSLLVALEGYDLTAPVESDGIGELLLLIPIRHKEAAVNNLYDVEIAVDREFSLFQKTVSVTIKHRHRFGEQTLTFQRPAEAHYRKFSQATVVRRKDGRDPIVTVERQPQVLVELFDDLAIDAAVADAYVKCLVIQELFGAFDETVLD
jgi:hypothetical protein